MQSFVPRAEASTVPESPPSRWNPKSYGVSVTSEYFSSDSNYDETRGSFSRISGGRNLTVFETRPRLRYSFVPAVSAFAGTSFAQTKAVDLTTEKTSANMNEVFGGVDFQLNHRWWRVVPELEFSYPITASTAEQTTAMTGEGVPFFRAGVFLFKPYRKIRFESYLGFHYPGEGLAKRFMYALSTELAIANGFSVGGGVDGYETILSDDLTQSQRAATHESANAGSARFWAYNPALLEAKGWLGFRADRAFSFRLGYARSINGIRAAAGSTVLLAIAFNSAGDKDGPVSTPDRGDFKVEPEVVDPELFDQQQERKKQKTPEEQNLDSTEKMLENRR